MISLRSDLTGESRMSSVSGSSDSARNDEIKRNRDEYNSSESASAKKHQKEIRKLNEDHVKEIENLKASHAKQLEDLQARTRQTMTDRDQKYQEDIDNIRSLHR